MQKFKTLDDAVALARFAHRNQTDKAGLPYIDHPLRVLEKVKAQGALPYVQIAAVLHDVTEDSAFTPAMLLDLGFAEPAVEIVKLLDRDYSREVLLRDKDNNHRILSKDLTDQYYYTQIKANPGAKMVKNADMDDNCEPWRLSYFTEETQQRLLAKYAKGRQLIT